MPSLKLCSRRWSFGSDDLLLPASFLIFIHVSCLACLVAATVMHLFSPFSLSCTVPSNSSSVIENPEVEEKLPCPSFVFPAIISITAFIVISTTVLEIIIAYFSNQGTIMNAGPRDAMKPFLGIRYFFVILEVFMVASIYVWWYGCLCNQSNSIASLVLVIGICENVIVALLILFAICSFDSSGGQWMHLQKAMNAASAATATMSSPVKYTNSSASNTLTIGSEHQYRMKLSHTKRRIFKAHQAKEAYTKSWLRQFNILFCCLGSKRTSQQSTFLEVATIFGELFGDADLVGSDLIAGFILLRKAQKQVIRESVTKRKKILSGVPVSFKVDDDDDDDGIGDTNGAAVSSLLDPDSNEADALLILRIIRMFHFAYSATGWLFYSMRHPGFLASGPLQKCCCRNSELTLEGLESRILHDNLCKLNTQALLRQTGIPPSDFIFADFDSGISEAAFVVLLDAKLKAVVVSVRGTVSLSDVVTDLNADSAQIPLDNAFLMSAFDKVDSDVKDWLAHKGMLTAAISLRDRLINEHILDNAYAEADKLYGGETGRSNFKLILVGHSLGAGVASLLGILLRPLQPDLHVFAFSPPGGLLGYGAAKYTQAFVTSVILGKDVVPRIGLRQIEALRADIINVLRTCRQKKWVAIGKGINCCCSRRESRENVDFATIKTMRNSVAIRIEELSVGGSETGTNPEPENVDLEKNCDEAVADDLDHTLISNHNSTVTSAARLSGLKVHHHALQLPGVIYHIVRQWKPPSSNQEQGKVVLRVVRSARSIYDHVLVSPRMISDHMPNGFMDALEALAKQHNLDNRNMVPFPREL